MPLPLFHSVHFCEFFIFSRLYSHMLYNGADVRHYATSWVKAALLLGSSVHGKRKFLTQSRVVWGRMLTSSLLQTLMRKHIITINTPIMWLWSHQWMGIHFGNYIVVLIRLKYVISCFPVSWFAFRLFKRVKCFSEEHIVFSLCPLGSFLSGPNWPECQNCSVSGCVRDVRNSRFGISPSLFLSILFTASCAECVSCANDKWHFLQWKRKWQPKHWMWKLGWILKQN